MAVSDAARTPEQTARERGLLRVDDTIEEIALATQRARRARQEVALLAGCDDLARVLDTAAERLEAIRKELQQGGYLNAGQQRLF